MFKESILMSWQNIIHNKMRSFLTVLGVLIGVASIISLISIVQGVTDNITGQVMDLGGNKISIQVMGTPLKKGLTVTDLERIAKTENIKGVSPTVMAKSSIVYNGLVKENVDILGKNEVHFRYTADLIQTGRAIYKIDVQNKNKVCLIGNNLVDEYFKLENPIDKEIIINGTKYTIIGTLQKSSGFSAGSSDDSIIVPYTTAMSLMGT
jgi:putative ABC transport system permease protein